MAVVLHGSGRTTTIPLPRDFPRFLASDVSPGEGRGVPQRLSFWDGSTPCRNLRGEGAQA